MKNLPLIDATVVQRLEYHDPLDWETTFWAKICPAAECKIRVLLLEETRAYYLKWKRHHFPLHLLN